MSKANLFSHSSTEGVSSIAVELVASVVRSLLGPGTLDERISGARHQVDQLGRLGIRQALLRERSAEQEAVRNWVQAHRASLPPRSAAPPKRGYTTEATRVWIYLRDAFTCRYSRCRKRTVYLGVLRELASVFPDLLGTNPNWRPLDLHVVHWTCTTTLEHRVSFPHGGTESEANYLTACSQCQYAKNEYPLADAVWPVDDEDTAMPAPAVEAERWDGLSWSLAALRVALGRPIGKVFTGRPLVDRARSGSVIRNLSAGGLCYVDDAEGSRARARLLWTSGGQLAASRTERWADLLDGEWVEVLPVLPDSSGLDLTTR